MLYYTYITTFLSVKPYFSWWRGEGGAAAAGGGVAGWLSLLKFASEVCSFEHEALDTGLLQHLHLTELRYTVPRGKD